MLASRLFSTMDPQEPPGPLSKYAEPAAAERDASAHSDSDRTFGMLCHLLALTGYVVPFGNIIGPLVVWQMKKADSPFIDACGKESINFQISLFIYTGISILLALVFIGFLLLFAIIVANLVYVIIASIKASEGTAFRYPMTIRFIK